MRRASLILAALALLGAPALADDLPASKDGLLDPAEVAKLLPRGTDAVLTVLDTGSAPREELRYTLARGTVALTEEMTVDSNLTAVHAPAKHGTISTGRAVTIRTTESRAGGAHLEIEVTRISTNGEDLPIHGTIDADVSAKGKLSAIRELGAMSPTGFQTSIVVLPDGPVGKGARWRLIRMSPGDRAIHVETYTLRARDKHVLELEVSSVQFMVAATLPVPNLGDATVRRYEYRSTGHVTIDTTAPVPLSMDDTAHQHLELSTTGDELAVDSTTTTRTTAKPAR